MCTQHMLLRARTATKFGGLINQSFFPTVLDIGRAGRLNVCIRVLPVTALFKDKYDYEVISFKVRILFKVRLLTFQ